MSEPSTETHDVHLLEVASPAPTTEPLAPDAHLRLQVLAAQERAAAAELALVQERRARLVDQLVVAYRARGLGLVELNPSAGTATVRPAAPEEP